MRALLYAALFFATCTEEQCELDTAVKQLEGLTAELNKLSAADTAEFRAFLVREAAAHPRAAVATEILQFAEAGARDVVYIESQAGDLFLESDTDLSRFRAIFEHLRALALPPDESVALIHGAARDL